jgi:NAD(P)H-quinone oxidoreductase subunit 5
MLAVVALPGLVALAALIMTGMGAGPSQQPGLFVLGVVVLLGLAKPWLAWREIHGLLAAAAMSALLIAAYLAGQAIFARTIGELGPLVAPTPPAVASAMAIVVFMTGLVCLQLRAPGRTGSAAWARAYALVSNGFHLNTIANRWVLRFWPAAPSKAHNSGAAA